MAPGTGAIEVVLVCADCTLALAALRDAQPGQSADNDASTDDGTDADASFCPVGKTATVWIGDDGDGLGWISCGAVAGAVHLGAMLPIIAAPCAIGALELGGSAPLGNGRQ